jgi:anti-anti-sigma factor
VSLEFSSRRLGDITIVTLAGGIAEGPDSAALRRHLDEVLPFGPYVILNLEHLTFIDSSGIGLLVRYLTRLRNARGALRVCSLSPKLAEVLRVTKLAAVFDADATEADAIGAIYLGARPSADAPFRFGTDILCIDESPDIQAYVREMLGQAGYGVAIAGNIADGLVLLAVTKPKAIVISARQRVARSAASAEKFNRLADALPTIELPVDFSRRDAGEAGRKLLEQVRALASLRSS